MNEILDQDSIKNMKIQCCTVLFSGNHKRYAPYYFQQTHITRICQKILTVSLSFKWAS